MHVLDSDTLSLYQAGHRLVVERFAELPPEEIATTVITKAELRRGRCAFLLKASSADEVQRAQERLEATEALLSDLFVLPFDRGAASALAELERVGKLRRFGRADLLISSIVLAREAVLVTRNLRHFRPVPRLQVVNWAD